MNLRFDGPVAVIGDIHGRSDLLVRLLAAIGDTPVLVIGDLGDRGLDTRGVMDRLVERSSGGVMGNHDLWFRAWATGRGFEPFALTPIMGG